MIFLFVGTLRIFYENPCPIAFSKSFGFFGSDNNDLTENPLQEFSQISSASPQKLLLIAHVRQNFPFALQSRVNPHAGFEVLPLTLQSEIGGHRIISLIKIKFEAFDLRKVRPLLLKIAKEKGKTYEEVKRVFYEKIEIPTREKIPKVIEEVFSQDD